MHIVVIFNKFIIQIIELLIAILSDILYIYFIYSHCFFQILPFLSLRSSFNYTVFIFTFLSVVCNCFGKENKDILSRYQ